VSETSYTHSDKDILRLYEIWLKTGSRRVTTFSSASVSIRRHPAVQPSRAARLSHTDPMILKRLQDLIGGHLRREHLSRRVRLPGH